MFVGGFIISLAMQRWNLHKRIALKIVLMFGVKPDRLILGFMVAAAILSMWISNTATAVMMLPVGLALLTNMEEEHGPQNTQNFSKALMLGLAWACSIGGIATFVGTPPNLAFRRIFEITFPQAPEIGFGEWFILGLPMSMVLLFCTWLLLTRVFFKTDHIGEIKHEVVNSEYQALGKIGFEEKSVLFVFLLTVVLWIGRKFQIGDINYGWSQWLSHPKYIDDGAVAIAMAILLFCIPSKAKTDAHGQKSSQIVESNIIGKLPWDIILLFGGGFAIAKGFDKSGLSQYIGNQFATLEGVPILFILIVVATGVTFLTELTSNMSTTEMLLPLLGAVSVAIKTNPMLLMVVATFSASMAFMLPIATAPNAIVFGSKRLSMIDMAKVGFFLNIIGIIVIVTAVYFIGPYILPLSPDKFPEWANPKP